MAGTVVPMDLSLGSVMYVPEYRKLWFIGDPHFGHGKIVELSKRPFKDITEMEATIITRYNSRVAHNDVVFFLGDFSFYKDGRSLQILKLLKGEKHLIVGNHDTFVNSMNLPWVSVSAYREVSYRQQIFVLFHYPIEEWNGYFKGTIHVHGHIHQNELPPNARPLKRVNACVDACDFAPIDAAALLHKFRNFPAPLAAAGTVVTEVKTNKKDHKKCGTK